MNKINIETYENEKKANFKIYIDEKLELDVKGLRYNNTNDLMDEITRSYERYTSNNRPKQKVTKGTAKYAGYYEMAQAIEMIPTNKQFTSKDMARLIVDETSSKFGGTHANISAALSTFEKSKYPSWLEVIGKQGRSKLYKKNRDVTTRQIEADLRRAAKNSSSECKKMRKNKGLSY